MESNAHVRHLTMSPLTSVSFVLIFSSPLITPMDDLSRSAVFAFYLTTPMKATVTHFFHFTLTCCIPSVTAHQITPVSPLGRVVTQASFRPERTRFGIAKTKVWRVFIVDQVSNCGCLVQFVFWTECRFSFSRAMTVAVVVLLKFHH